MKLHNLSGRECGGYTTFGSAWKQGEKTDNQVLLTNENNESLPVQSRVTAWWPDGSIKWLSHTADSDRMGGSATLLPYDCEERTKAPVTDGISIRETESGFDIDTGVLSLNIPKFGGNLAEAVTLNGQALAARIYPVFLLKRNNEIIQSFGDIEHVTVEENGPLQAVFCFRGRHLKGRIAGGGSDEAVMPFVIRLYFGQGSPEIRVVHTFLYDGNEHRDFLKGMGIRTETLLTGNPYDKHIKFAADGRVFHETAMTLYSRFPRLEPEVQKRQLAGEFGRYGQEEEVIKAARDLPLWSKYTMLQDSASHYRIKKKTQPDCCYITGREGRRGLGAMAVSGLNGSVLLGLKDFWEKYPSGLEADHMGQEIQECTMWFYSPEAESYDFRHYDTRSYPMTCYEGFDYLGASAYGIGVTSEGKISFEETLVSNEKLLAYGRRVQKPTVYVAEPEYYYEKHSFGYWSLPKYDTRAGCWAERQLEQAFAFYQQEVAARNWYGLFDYGDIMHTYDFVRHCWRYDIGGFAWQNTELVDTYWLWLYFLRTGREDVYTMCEAMSRHCSEVDVYHFGKYKGIGSRHNVRHWGCSCKEPRIAMAGHHRFLYYLTGDYRLGDIFDEVKEADLALLQVEEGKKILPDGSEALEVRSGPDWSSYVSNWMTHYERTLDEKYRKKIETGTRDIAAAPFGLASGPDYYYEIDKAHLIYRGEIENTPNQHLQICMGGPQIWWETADMLGDDTLNQLLEKLGAFYTLSQEEKNRLTDGKIGSRPFSWPMLATGVMGYSAMRRGDRNLAREAWEVLLSDLFKMGNGQGFAASVYEVDDLGHEHLEIAGITTNATAQICLNMIMCLEFIPEALEEVWKGEERR